MSGTPNSANRPRTPEMAGDLSTWGFAGSGGGGGGGDGGGGGVGKVDARGKPRPFTPMKTSERPLTASQRELVRKVDPTFVSKTEEAIDKLMNEDMKLEEELEELEAEPLEARQKKKVDGPKVELVNPADMLKTIPDDKLDDDEDEMEFYKRFLEERRAESRGGGGQ